ncbi:hypothetical protein KIN20_001345 [Parelaphostrongylus tenuis]|uniref:Uncharacterized protein n=1 Tax=Parelaphostrongylus tenuis TaxID=148309 RepID=A0AAD5MET9_PARTN|nr:hypothetical protein KIN20_001345 [Parelaphostrongylus tenuis]
MSVLKFSHHHVNCLIENVKSAVQSLEESKEEERFCTKHRAAKVTTTSFREPVAHLTGSDLCAHMFDTILLPM